MGAERATNDRDGEQMSRGELVALGKRLVTERLEALGCTVQPPSGLLDGRMDVVTPSGRSFQIFVSTQRVGGYAFWTKRRLQPAKDRFAAVVLLPERGDPELYLVPSTDWLQAAPPLKDRDNIGKKSEPEFGISLARSSLPALARYRWDGSSNDTRFA